MNKVELMEALDIAEEECERILEKDGILHSNEAYDALMGALGFCSEQEQERKRP